MDVRPGKQHFGRCGMKRLWALVDTLPPNRRPTLLRGDVGYGNIAGGRMPDECFGAYANYLVKYVQAYGKEGIRIAALTVQNEPNTDQFGMSPTCL